MSMVCDKYYRRIGNEVIFQSMSEQLFEVRTKDMPMEPGYNEYLGIDKNIKLTLSDFPLMNIARRARINMRLVYLINLFEGFMKEYIAERENISLEEITNITKAYGDSWKNQKHNIISNSTSFMNINYSLYFIRSKYDISLEDICINPCTYECGSLRNLFVHYNGDINNKEHGVDFAIRLAKTLEVLRIDNNYVILTEEFIDLVAGDLQLITRQCNY